MSSIGNISSYLQSLLGTALQNAGLTSSNSSGSSSSSISPSSFELPTDNQQLSPFAQLMSTLQQLQQSDPTKYQQVTQQIATNLQSAAQTAQTAGNSTAASQLDQLATDFSNASETGQLPNIQDLALATGGHNHHHHHSQAASTESDSTSSASSSSSGASSGGSPSQTSSQLLSSFQPTASSNDSLNAMSIILNTLSNAGISTSNS